MVAPYLRTSANALPGYGDNGSIVINHFWAEDERDLRWAKGIFLGTATDAGATPTSLLRSGLLVAKIFGDADNKFFVPWNPVATDGSQIIRGVFKGNTGGGSVDLKAANASGQDGHFLFAWGGIVRPERLIIPGSATMGIAGNAWEYLVREQMTTGGRFRFHESDWIDPPLNAFYAPVQIDKAAAYTILEKESGSLFTNLGASGSVALTLPAPKRGLAYRFMTLAAQDLVITAPTVDTLIVASDLTADSVTLTLAEVGAVAEAFVVRTAADTYRWVVTGQVAADSGGTIQT